MKNNKIKDTKNEGVKYIQGYIVVDNYFDPVQYEYRMFHDKNDAYKAAKNRIVDIVESEELSAVYKFDNVDELVDTFVDDLQDYDHCIFRHTKNGFSGDTNCVRIAEVYTQP